MTASRLEELRLLTRVARMYHEDGLRQGEIAASLHLSQPRVSRLLRRATETGIVRTVVTPPPGLHAELEDRLRDVYGLLDAVVADAPESGRDVTPALGAATAAYLETTLTSGERLGVASWSATLMAAAEAMPRRTTIQAEQIVQLVGGLGTPRVQMRATGLVARLADLTAARAVLVPAPGLLPSQSVRDALVADPGVAAGMAAWDELTMALVGIGSLEPSSLLEASGNAIGPFELGLLRQLGAVGDVCFRFFDSVGVPVGSDLDRRVLGISVEQIRAIERRIGVAGGSRKLPAIRAALLGRWINVLVTDAASAQHLVDAAPS